MATFPTPEDIKNVVRGVETPDDMRAALYNLKIDMDAHNFIDFKHEKDKQIIKLQLENERLRTSIKNIDDDELKKQLKIRQIDLFVQEIAWDYLRQYKYRSDIQYLDVNRIRKDIHVWFTVLISKEKMNDEMIQPVYIHAANAMNISVKNTYCSECREHDEESDHACPVFFKKRFFYAAYRIHANQIW
jgi:hypothetical protein